MKVKVGQQVFREVEVAFPLYRRQDLEHSTIYMRVTNLDRGDRLRQVSITIGQVNAFEQEGAAVEIEIDNNYKFDARSGEDYQCGKGEYVSSAAEFGEAIEHVRELLSRV